MNEGKYSDHPKGGMHTEQMLQFSVETIDE